MKIAIVGSAPSTRELAPFDDPSWSIYGIAYHEDKLKRWDELFEIHLPLVMGPAYYTEVYITKCREWRPLCLPEAVDFLNGRSFPVRMAEKMRQGRWYLQGTASYMMAYAIMQDPDEIGIWGIDLVDDVEYPMQRPCLESWIGFAEGLGIKVTIPEQSALMSVPYRYGQEKPVPFAASIDKRDQLQAYLAYKIDALTAGYVESDFVNYVLQRSTKPYTSVSKQDIVSLIHSQQIATYEDVMHIVRCIERGIDMKAAVKV